MCLGFDDVYLEKPKRCRRTELESPASRNTEPTVVSVQACHTFSQEIKVLRTIFMTIRPNLLNLALTLFKQLQIDTYRIGCSA